MDSVLPVVQTQLQMTACSYNNPEDRLPGAQLHDFGAACMLGLSLSVAADDYFAVHRVYFFAA